MNCKQCSRDLDLFDCDHQTCKGARAQGFCSLSCQKWYNQDKEGWYKSQTVNQ